MLKTHYRHDPPKLQRTETCHLQFQIPPNRGTPPMQHDFYKRPATNNVLFSNRIWMKPL